MYAYAAVVRNSWNCPPVIMDSNKLAASFFVGRPGFAANSSAMACFTISAVTVLPSLNFTP